MFWRRRKKGRELEFDEILLDSSNLPSFNRGRLEGRMELPIGRRNVLIVGLVFAAIALLFYGKIFQLQVVLGQDYRQRSEENSIDKNVIIAERGVIYDRRGDLLAWNENDYTDQYDFSVRAYTDRQGLGQTVGYVTYPQKDSKGFYYRTEYTGVNGLEQAYDDLIKGENGEAIVEISATGEVISSHAISPPRAGEEVTVSIDSELSEAMYNIIATSSAKAGFRSGAGAIMNVRTGEIIAMTSFPSYDPEVMSDGDDVELIESYNNDERFPFLNKVVAGAYVPGSIVKPFLAYAALVENIITPNTVITSNGKLVIPNPYNPDAPTIFRDWREQGRMTVREAIAYSSDVFFYIIGGGLPEIAAPQAGVYAMEGLGITRINEYMHMFGFGSKVGISFAREQEGTVPNPEWKREEFDEDWYLGNTYHTSIGQYGTLVTPIQMLAAYGALANGGKLFIPHMIKDEVGEYTDINLDPVNLEIVTEGMRMVVNVDGGTARGLDRDDVAIAAKSGTAELGSDNAHVNSWAAGFWPYEDPEYSFILLMDRAPRSNTLGATTIMGQVVEWMSKNRPEYLGIDSTESE